MNTNGSTAQEIKKKKKKKDSMSFHQDLIKEEKRSKSSP